MCCWETRARDLCRKTAHPAWLLTDRLQLNAAEEALSMNTGVPESPSHAQPMGEKVLGLKAE